MSEQPERSVWAQGKAFDAFEMTYASIEAHFRLVKALLSSWLLLDEASRKTPPSVSAPDWPPRETKNLNSKLRRSLISEARPLTLLAPSVGTTVNALIEHLTSFPSTPRPEGAIPDEVADWIDEGHSLQETAKCQLREWLGLPME